MIERWKPIKGYEGLYEVSDWGRVRSIDHYVNCKSKSKRLVKSRILKVNNNNRYPMVCLSKKDNKRSFLVHRLVAEAFIPNPNNLSEVNHKSECKFFNHYSCLEWCDRLYNCRYGSGAERKIQNNPRIKKINQFTLDGEFIKEWPSQAEIARVLGCSQAVIWACCSGEQKTSYGYIWRYAS